MADIASPIKTLFSGPAIDPTVATIGSADQVADGAAKVMMTTDQRNDLSGVVGRIGGLVLLFPDDGYAGGLFDAAGYPVDAMMLTGAQVSSTAAQVSAVTSQVAAAAGSGLTPIFLDDGYAAGSFDASGFPINATPVAGGTVGLLQLGYSPIFTDDGYSLVVADASGAVAFGVPAGSVAAVYDALVPVIDTDGAVRVLNDTADVKVASALGMVLTSPKIAGDLLRWVDRQGAVRERRQFSLVPWSPGAFSKLVLVPFYGQSLSVGTASGALHTVAPIAPGRALMFNGGARPLIGPTWDRYPAPGDHLRGVTDDRISTLVDLREQLEGTTGETQLSGVAQWMTRGGVTEVNAALLLETFGIGGTYIGLLAEGTKPYANLLRAIERAKAIADYLGIALEVPAILYDQGESDYGTGTFKTQLLALQTALSTDIAAIMGDTLVRPLLCWQPSSWTASAFNAQTAVSPLLILDAAITNPTQVRVIGPQYFDPAYAGDGVHKLSVGYRRYGEYAGRSLAAFRAGNATGALFATAASATGTALSVTFNRACSIQSSVVTDPGQFGVRLVNTVTGATIALSDIVITGATLTATAASPPTGSGWVVGIADVGTAGQPAGPTSGPRACIRDTSADVGSDGALMHNWACHQQVALTIN